MVQVFYSDNLKRLFISERVNITNKFSPDEEFEDHVKQYQQ